MGGVADGKLYSGFLYTVPEIGHVTIDFQGKKCRSVPKNAAAK